MRNDDWLDDYEYPDERDIEEFGYDSPLDDDPLTIGYLGESHSRLWTTKRIVGLTIVLLLIGVLLLPFLLRLLG